MNTKLISEGRKMTNLKELYELAVQMSTIQFQGNLATYQLSILGETATSFVIGRMGQITGNDEQFFKEERLLGFTNIDAYGQKIERGETQASFSKLDVRISGNWNRLVDYKGWLVRVIDETDTDVRLMTDEPGTSNLGFERVGGSISGLLWVPKSDVKELE